jgi:hypothetical protein
MVKLAGREDAVTDTIENKDVNHFELLAALKEAQPRYAQNFPFVLQNLITVAVPLMIFSASRFSVRTHYSWSIVCCHNNRVKIGFLAFPPQ